MIEKVAIFVLLGDNARCLRWGKPGYLDCSGKVEIDIPGVFNAKVLLKIAFTKHGNVE